MNFGSSAWCCGFRPTPKRPRRDRRLRPGADGGEKEVDRERWSLSLQFLFLEKIPPELMVFNPMGIVITYLQGDRAMVTERPR